MRATSLLAAMQSWRESRLPFMILTWEPFGRCLSALSILACLLEGRAKQTRFRKPRSSKPSTTLAPIKPPAPVTRIGSSDETTKEPRLSFISEPRIRCQPQLLRRPFCPGSFPNGGNQQDPFLEPRGFENVNQEGYRRRQPRP